MFVTLNFLLCVDKFKWLLEIFLDSFFYPYVLSYPLFYLWGIWNTCKSLNLILFWRLPSLHSLFLGVLTMCHTVSVLLFILTSSLLLYFEFSFKKAFIFVLFGYEYMHKCHHTILCVHGEKLKGVGFLHHMGSGDWTQAIRPSYKKPLPTEPCGWPFFVC